MAAGILKALGIGYSPAAAYARTIGLTAGLGSYAYGSYRDEIARRYTGRDDARAPGARLIGDGGKLLLGATAASFIPGKIGMASTATLGTFGAASIAAGSTGATDAYLGSAFLATSAMSYVAGRMTNRDSMGSSFLRATSIGSAIMGGTMVGAAVAGKSVNFEGRPSTEAIRSGGLIAGAGLVGYAGYRTAKMMGRTAIDGLVRTATSNKANLRELRATNPMVAGIAGLATGTPGRSANRARFIRGLGGPDAGTPTVNRLMREIPKSRPFIAPILAAHMVGMAAAVHQESLGIPGHLPEEYAGTHDMANNNAMPPEMHTNSLTLGIHRNRKRRHL